MSTNNEDVTQFLTDGSVWIRQKGKLKGQEVRLLLLTNVDLIGTAAAEEHPVRVVYANAKNQIFDREVDDFCGLYKFHHVDGDLETKLERLLAFEEPEVLDDDDEDEDDETTDAPASAATTLFDTPPTKSTSSEVKAGTLADEILSDLTDDEPANESPATLGIKFKISEVPSYTRPMLNSDDLETALVGYVQEPAWSHGLLNHRLTFRLGGPVTLSTLREVFEPSEATDTVTSFSGVVAGEFFDTVWTTWIGAFPEAIGGDQFVSIHVGTEYVPQEHGDQDEEPHADEVLQQSAPVETQAPAQQVSAPELQATPSVEVINTSATPAPAVPAETVAQAAPNVQVVAAVPVAPAAEGQPAAPATPAVPAPSAAPTAQ